MSTNTITIITHPEFLGRLLAINDQLLTSRLARHLLSIARRNGIAGFTAEVLRDNRRMQKIFNHSGYKVKSSIEEGVYSFVIDF